MFRRMNNQQRGLPRRNQMPMRTGGNFGGGFALNPALRNLSTVMQPRFKGQGDIETNPDIIAALEVPGGGTFIGAGGRKTTVEPGYIAPPSPNNTGRAVIREGEGTFSPNNTGRAVIREGEQSTIDNAALQERLKGRYDAPGYTKGQKIAAIAGVLGDVFSAPGDRNKTATIMQTIEAQRAGDMKRQQARLADEQNTALVDGLIDSGQVKPEMRELFIARPDLIGELGLQKVVEGGEGFQLEKQSIIAGIKKTEATISDMITNSLRKDAEFQQGILENDQDYDIRLRTIANQEARTAIENAGLDETIRKNKASQQKDRNKKPEINFKDEQSLRKEYASQTKEFPKVRDAYLRIQASSDGTAASDLSLIFNYMKVLDPGSTVREGEFANAQNAAGVGTRIGNLYNQMIKGTRLSDEQRKEFLSTARNLYGEQEKTYQNTVTSYRELATAYGLDPERSVPMSRVVKDANDDQPNVFGD